MNKRRMFMGALACLIVASADAVADSESSPTVVRLSTGIEYSSGDYGGTADVDETYLPVTVSVSRGRVAARLTVPYLSVDGSGSPVVEDPESDVVGSESDSGLGDIIGSVTIYDVLRSSQLSLAVDLTGKVKFGTADEDKGLGTGENDYSVLADVYKFYDRLALVGTLGYKFRGEPAGLSVDDVFLGSVGGFCTCSERTRIGLFYDYREASLTDSDDLRELSLYGSRDLNRAWTIQYYVFRGLTDNGPDWGGGFQVGVNLARHMLRDRG